MNRAPESNPSSRPTPGEFERPSAARDRTLHMIGNAHLDLVWLWPWQEAYQEARATFWSAINRMDEYPDFVFTCDQIVLLAWIEESDPILFERIRERVAEGRWVNVGGWWVEPDCNIPTGESFARQGLLGQRYLQSRFGKPAPVGMNVDPFGHNGMIPQILQLQGMDAYTFLRPGPHESDLVESAFWWESPDGSRVLAWRIPYEYMSPAGPVARQTEKALGQIGSLSGHKMVFYGVGNHGGGPTIDNIESIRRYDAMGSFGKMIFSSPPQFFADLRAEIAESSEPPLPVRKTELQHHAPGCYSAHSGVKAWLRRAQSNVLVAERWGAVAAQRFGITYPRDDLTRAWEQVSLNQFHDILPGSAIESAYDDVRDQLGEAVAISKRIITRTHNAIARQIQIDVDTATQPVVVFNPHSWPLTTVIELHYGGEPNGVFVVDESGQRVPSQRVQSTASTDDEMRGASAFRVEVPPLGYRLYRLVGALLEPREPLVDADPAPAVHVDPHSGSITMDNGRLRATVGASTGWLTELLLLDEGVDVIAGATGDHARISQDPTDTWGHRVVSYAGPGVEMSVDRLVVVEEGPLRVRVRVERSWGRSLLIEDFILSRGSDSLEVRAEIDWREKAHLLKLRFPTAVDNPVATYEVPWGHVERPVDGVEYPGQSWIDLSGTVGERHAGLTVVNNAKHAYDASPASSMPRSESPSMGITAVRSPVYSWHDPRELEDANRFSYQDQGIQRFEYALVPHLGGWEASDPMRRAAEVGTKPRAMFESFHDGALPPVGSFGAVDSRVDGPGGVLVSALKGSEDLADDGTDSAVVRCYEWTGQPGTTTVRVQVPVLDGFRTIEAEFGPSQIRTFVVPNARQADIREVDLVEWDIGTRARGVWTEVPTAAAKDDSTNTSTDSGSGPGPATLPGMR
ncbi:alpha-mannosidase [Paraoerskovia marina]